MPILNLEVDVAGRLVADLYVGVTAAEAESLGDEDRHRHAVRQVRALVDTGAGRTVIGRAVLEQLGLMPVSEVTFHSATTGRDPVNAAVYAVELSLAGETLGTVAAELEVLGAEDLSGLGVEALLGRDVLGRGLLIYNGPRRQFTLVVETLASLAAS
jgi:predicted aspartyl protease